MTGTVLTPTAAARLFSRPAAVASCVGFVLIGMLQALYGPAVPGLRAEFGLSPSGAGLGLSLHFTGGVAGVLAFDAVHARISNRTLITASCALMAAGAAGFALASGWPLALAASTPCPSPTTAVRSSATAAPPPPSPSPPGNT